MPSLPPHDPAGHACPRCGGGLRRQPRKPVHRLISIVYPVKYYACERHCGWSGSVGSRSGMQAQKRRIQAVMLMVAAVLGLVLGAKILTERMANAASEAPADE